MTSYTMQQIIDRTIEADLGNHPMFRPQQFTVLPLGLSEFRHVNPEVDIFDPEGNRQRALNYIKARYGTLQEWEGYPVTQDNTGLFQTQPGTFMQGRKNGKSPVTDEYFKSKYGKVDTARQHLERRITNQRKELKRLNACLKMQAAQAIQQGKRFDLRTRQNGILEDRNTQLQRQLEHERALSAYWHNEFKALKKNRKGKKK